MKKFICAILICLSLSFSLTLTGCNDSDYNIKLFYTTYQDIAKNAKNLTLTEADNTYQLESNSYKIEIDYSKSTKLSSLVNDNSTQYYQLKHFYQQLLDDSLSPLYFFGDIISNNKKVSDKQTKQLFKNLSSLEQEYKDIDYYVGILINSLNATNNTTINLSNLKKVFVQYEEAITQANNLSSIVCDVYFNTILNGSNIDYSGKTYDQLTEGDLVRITLDTRARMYYYKSVYANIYNQLYVRNSNLAEIISSSASASIPSYIPYTFVKNITSLESKPTNTLLSNKQNIYNNVVSLYYVQRSFTEAYNNFNLAVSKVAYKDLDSSSTDDELNYGIIINQFSNGIAYDAYEILSNLVDLLYL